VRLEHAVELLRTTEDKTYIIAAQVGYTEPNYFSYVFKKQYGISPSRYRAAMFEQKP
jgi:two-component system response regulator YesN